MDDSKICNGKFVETQTNYSVVIDDNGRVAYAYLLNKEGSIVGDVWLYNRCETPSLPEWKDPEKRRPEFMPFANSSEFVDQKVDFNSIKDISDVRVSWKINKNEKIKAFIFIRNQLIAKLEEEAKPGWSSLVLKSGPLAKVMNTVESECN